MSVEVLIGVVGVLVTLLVVVGMVLITPSGSERSKRSPERPFVEDPIPPAPAPEPSVR